MVDTVLSPTIYGEEHYLNLQHGQVGLLNRADAHSSFLFNSRFSVSPLCFTALSLSDLAFRSVDSLTQWYINQMKWVNDLRRFAKYNRITEKIFELGSSGHNVGDLNFLRPGILSLQERSIWGKNSFEGFALPFSSKESHLNSKPSAFAIFRQFGRTVRSDSSSLSRDVLAQLWFEDKKMKRHRRKRKMIQRDRTRDAIYDNLSSFQMPGRWFSGAPIPEERYSEPGQRVLKQPPLSQSTTGYLEPASPEEEKVAPLLARSNLLITRDIEWANLMLGFEQENRYAIVDACYPQSPVGLIREQSNLIARQLLRTRRPFVAYISDAMGNELFRVRRPFWWITSTIYVEIDGKEIGVVHRRWHLWKRVYDLYLGNKQFAEVVNPGFWNWTFTLKDIDGNVLAQIDRDWRGFGFELFTDAGQYVIRFGNADPSFQTEPVRMVQELEISRPLTLSERAVAVALAVSLDNDYFSRHGGWGIPFFVVGE
ncbi:phospholipid scramblase family protein C343.06c [Telopea speciosissima]|uniref:phospholipid scramblase family protein C343.06c n=1 Tax=Telopea speciosissima TaxID=54955 RepID=UPI001CC4C799|nr:phospholipid scramblase family protein C343.06c [Telopea speciosissima]